MSQDSGSASVRNIIMMPAVITLAVTLVRLAGELSNWSPTLFSREAGGGGALIGIVWLVPVFGFYFAWKLAQKGPAPSAGTVALHALGSLAAFLVIMIGLFAAFGQTSLAPIVLGSILAIPVSFLNRRAWAPLTTVLLNYGLAARIPVAIIMLFAILGNWGTHYDGPPPDFPAMAAFPKWIVIGLLPQLGIWVGFTIIVGSLFGAIALLLAKR